MRLTRGDICVGVAECDNRLVFLNVFVIVFFRLAIVIVLVTCNVGNAAATTAPTHNLLVDDATYGTISFRGRVIRTSGIDVVEATLISSPKHGVWFKHRSRRDGRGGNRHELDEECVGIEDFYQKIEFQTLCLEKSFSSSAEIEKKGTTPSLSSSDVVGAK